MTLKESWQIKQMVQALLLKGRYTSVAELRGHSITEVNKAFKLIVAKQYRDLIGTASLLQDANVSVEHDFKLEFTKAVNTLESGITALSMKLLSHPEWQELGRHAEYSPEWLTALSKGMSAFEDSRDFREMSKQETIEAFANNFLRSVPPNDPLFWQKVYTHLELPYHWCAGMEVGETM